MSNPAGKNEPGRTITYRVFKTKDVFFDYEAGRFSEARVRNECKKRGFKPPVVVKYSTRVKWGYDFKAREVTWEG